MSFLGRLPLYAGVALVGAVAGGVVVLGYYATLGVYTLVLLAVPLVVAVLYLREYSRKELVRPARVSGSLPRTAKSPPSRGESPPVEPFATPLTLFDDDVLETSLASAAAPATPSPTDRPAG